MQTKMSRSEKIVAGLAVAMLVAGFATGVLAKPQSGATHSSLQYARLAVVQQND